MTAVPLFRRQDDLIARYLEGTLSDDEDLELAALLNHDDDAVRRVVELMRMEDLMDEALHEERSVDAFLAAMRLEMDTRWIGRGNPMTSQAMPVVGERIMEENELQREEDLSLAAALGQQWRSAPWYMSSVAVHCLIFLLLLLVPVDMPTRRVSRVIVECDVIQEEQKIEEPENDIVERDPEIVTDQTNPEPAPVIVTTDFEIADHNETADDMDMETARGDPDSISTFDDIEGSPALMGVGASGGKGGGGRFGFRNGGGRRNAVARGGGSRRTESAVDWALRWLAEHQEADGHWDNVKYGGGDENRRRNGVKLGGDNADVAVTSLALLAFLGSGNSTRFGKYKKQVHKGVYWLMSKQEADGSICHQQNKKGYTWGISLMALAEAYGMSNDGGIKQVAQKCVDWTCAAQCPAGGWNYTAKATRNDTSVTGWQIMGLKSAKVAGLHVPYEVIEKALKYMQHATTQPRGDKGYGGTCQVSYSSTTATVEGVKAGGGKEPMNAVGLTCLQFLGRPRVDPQVNGCANQVLVDGLPTAEKFDFYRWYYAALGLFQMGTKNEAWRKWNEPMKKTLLSTQVKAGTFKENKGSWNPETDTFGGCWGRVGQTALGALMLEVYYRYYDTHAKKKQ